MLPLSMYHKDRTAQHSALNPQSLTLGVCTCVLRCTRIVAFFINCPLSILLIYAFSLIHPCCRSERDIVSKRISQHKAISSAQVAIGIVKSLVEPNHGPLISAPFTCCCMLPCASVACGVSRPQDGALVVHTRHLATLFFL